MELIKGSASKIRFSTNVSGGESTSTEQIAIFEISGQSVEFRSQQSIIIEEGDDCTVAGIIKNGLFNALALNNKTKGVYSVNNSMQLKIFGSIFTAIGIVTIPVLIGIVFTYAGVKIIRSANKINAAHEMILEDRN